LLRFRGRPLRPPLAVPSSALCSSRSSARRLDGAGPACPYCRECMALEARRQGRTTDVLRSKRSGARTLTGRGAMRPRRAHRNSSPGCDRPQPTTRRPPGRHALPRPASHRHPSRSLLRCWPAQPPSSAVAWPHEGGLPVPAARLGTMSTLGVEGKPTRSAGAVKAPSTGSGAAAIAPSHPPRPATHGRSSGR